MVAVYEGKVKIAIRVATATIQLHIYSKRIQEMNPLFIFETIYIDKSYTSNKN